MKSTAYYGGEMEKSYTHETKGAVCVLSAAAEEYPFDISAEDGRNTIHSETDADIRDMSRLGKKQELRRNFSFISTLGFISIYMATWEYNLVSLTSGLVNGGFAGITSGPRH